MLTVKYGMLRLLIVLVSSLFYVKGQKEFDDLATDENTVFINELQFLGTHNSYHVAPSGVLRDFLNLLETFVGIQSQPELQYTHADYTTQFNTQNVRHLEIDVFADSSGGLFSNRKGLAPLQMNTASGIAELDEPGYKVLHIQDIDYDTTSYTFVDSLTTIKNWSTANVGHLPITIFLEVKEDTIDDPLALGLAIPEKANFTTLEEEIRSVFNVATDLIIPDNIRGANLTLKAGVLTNGWPTLAASRGKIMFVLLTYQDDYVGGDFSLTGKLLFPMSDTTREDAAFIDRPDPLEATDIGTLVTTGYMVRARCDIGTIQARNGNTTMRDEAISSGAQYISTDYPFPLIENVNIELGTNYAVNLRPRCNPINTNVNCVQTSTGEQPMVTVPDELYVSSGDNNSFSFADLFPDGVALDDKTTDFIKEWTTLAGRNSTMFEIPFFLPKIYKPSFITNSMHSIPRISGTDEFSASTDYLKGLALICGILVGVGLLLTVLTTVWLYCCCCKKKKKLDEKYDRRYSNTSDESDTVYHEFDTSYEQYPSTWPCTFRTLIFALSSLILLAGMGVTGYGVYALSDYVKEENQTLDRTREVLRITQSFLKDLITKVGDITTLSDNMKSLCPNTTISDLVNDMANVTDYVTDNVLPKIDGLPEEIAYYRDMIDKYNDYVFWVCLLFIAVTTLLVGLFFFALIFQKLRFKKLEIKNNRFIHRGIKCCITPTFILIMALFFVLLAILITLNIGVADFCVRPDEVIVDILPADNVDYLAYYAKCEGNNTIISYIDEQRNLLHLSNDGGFLLEVDAGQCATEDNKLNYLQNVEAIQRIVSDTDTALMDIRISLDCAAVNLIYSEGIYDNFCDGVGVALTFIWAGLCAAVFGMLFSILTYGSLVVGTSSKFGGKRQGGMSGNGMLQVDSNDGLGANSSTSINKNSDRKRV